MRDCPVCGVTDASMVMKFTPEQLCKINSSYSLEKFKRALVGLENRLYYSRCHNCGMIYCEKTWDKVTLNMIYDDVIDHSSSKDKISLVNKRLSLASMWLNILRVEKLFGRQKLDNFKIIDFGCGWGDLLDMVDGYGVSVMGYDEDSAKTESSVNSKHSIAANIAELKLFGPVDVVVMNSVLEHLQDVDKHMKTVKQLIKPDGLFVFAVTDYRAGFIKKNIRKLNKNCPALTKNLNPIEHVNIYNYNSAMASLERYAFDFVATGNVLRIANCFNLKNMSVVRIFNALERLSAKLLTRKEMYITVFAKNRK